MNIKIKAFGLYAKRMIIDQHVSIYIFIYSMCLFIYLFIAVLALYSIANDLQ